MRQDSEGGVCGSEYGNKLSRKEFNVYYRFALLFIAIERSLSGLTRHPSVVVGVRI